MALAKYHATLEYGNNRLEFWNQDSTGYPIPFDATTTIEISRLDDTKVTISSIGTNSENGDPLPITSFHSVAPEDGTAAVERAHILIEAKIEEDSIQPGDTLYDYDHPVFEHIWSLKSDSQTYIYGKLNMIKTA